MRWFTPSAFRVWQRNRDVFLALGKSEMPGIIAEPLLVLLAMGYGLGAYVSDIGGRDEYIEFIAPGIIAAYGMFSACLECTYGSFFRMDVQKTYDAIIATPLSVEDVVAGEAFWGATRSLITTAAVLIIAMMFGAISSPWAILALPVGFLAGLMFASISLTFTAIAPGISSFNYFFTLFATPMFFFSGVFFPMDEFPDAVQTFSWLAPLRSVSRIMRGVVEGELEMGLLGALALIVVITVAFFQMSLILMRKRLMK